MCHRVSSPFIKKKKRRKKGNGGAGTPKEAAAEGGFLPLPARPGSSFPDCAASGRRANGTGTINSHGHELPQEALAAHQLLHKIDCLPPPQTQPGLPPPHHNPPHPGPGDSAPLRGRAGGGRGVTHTNPPAGRTGPPQPKATGEGGGGAGAGSESTRAPGSGDGD